MWRTAHRRSLAERLLPATVLLATFMGGPVAVIAQQFTSDNTAVPPSTGSAAHVDSQITPEDVGDARLVEHRYQEAIEAYKKAHADSSTVWDKLGVAYEMMYDLMDAERCYREALRLTPNNARALSNLATVYDSLKEFRKAERLYRKALKLEPKSAVIALDLGTNLMVQYKYDEGWDMYRRALRIDSGIFETADVSIARNPMTVQQDGAINYYKAKGFAHAGMNDKAIKYLRRALNDGFTSSGKIWEDSSFMPLHGNPAFDSMIAEGVGE